MCAPDGYVRGTAGHDGMRPGSLPSGSPAPGSTVPGSTVPGSTAEALRMAGAAMDYLGGPGIGELGAAGLGEVLAALAGIGAKHAAARAAVLARFDAARGHDGDGYGSSAAWLAARTRMTKRDAKAEVRKMRQLREHPAIAVALAGGEVSESWAHQLAEWTRRLPQELRAETDRILLGAAGAGAGLEDLAVIAAAAWERWRSGRPDPDEPGDGFDDRHVVLGTTFGGAGLVRGNLTAECAAALQAVLESLGKNRGPEDTRTEAQRFHDALQEGCELLIRAKMVPDRAGADTRVDIHIPLAALRQMPGASELEAAWLAARAGQPGYLAGAGAGTAACDALLAPVVTGHPDLAVVDQMIGLILACLEGAAGTLDPAGREAGCADGADGGCADGDRAARSGPAADGSSPAGGSSHPGGLPGNAALRSRPLSPQALSRQALSPQALSPQAWDALRHAIARLAVDLVSGPAGLAAILRRGLLEAPYNSKSVPLDVGWSREIPAAIRRAVILRDRHCAWPGCGKPPSACDVHHLRHKSDGGPTSVSSCVLLCQFHHDICIHRWGWHLILHPDGTTEARGPRGQLLRSHAPPGGTP